MRRKTIALAAILLWRLCGFAAAGTVEIPVRQSAAVNMIPPLAVVESNVIAVKIGLSKIPDNAIVESVDLIAGRITAGKGPRLGVVVTQTMNLAAPERAKAMKKWHSLGVTTWTAAELGGDAIPVKGVWHISFTGQNVDRHNPASKLHEIKSLRITYRIPPPEE